MTYIKQLPQEEQERELRRLYREVFSTEKGKIVLTSILEHLKFFEPPVSEREEALRSFATFLIDYIVPGDTFDVVNALMSIKE